MPERDCCSIKWFGGTQLSGTKTPQAGETPRNEKYSAERQNGPVEAKLAVQKQRLQHNLYKREQKRVD